MENKSEPSDPKHATNPSEQDHLIFNHRAEYVYFARTAKQKTVKIVVIVFEKIMNRSI